MSGFRSCMLFPAIAPAEAITAPRRIAPPAIPVPGVFPPRVITRINVENNIVAIAIEEVGVLVDHTTPVIYILSSSGG